MCVGNVAQVSRLNVEQLSQTCKLWFRETVDTEVLRLYDDEMAYCTAVGHIVDRERLAIRRKTHAQRGEGQWVDGHVRAVDKVDME
mmetsp:Transcript_32187/g.47356  ORF Transcript_32187/g.47356 Transcript_32187/m.47356 type:complete len:86 (-) Transcript_32187:464-721(-)